MEITIEAKPEEIEKLFLVVGSNQEQKSQTDWKEVVTEKRHSSNLESVFAGLTFGSPAISREEYNSLYEDYVRRAKR